VQRVAECSGCIIDHIIGKGKRLNVAQDLAIYTFIENPGLSAVDSGHFFGGVKGDNHNVLHNFKKAMEINKRFIQDPESLTQRLMLYDVTLFRSDIDPHSRSKLRAIKINSPAAIWVIRCSAHWASLC